MPGVQRTLRCSRRKEGSTFWGMAEGCANVSLAELLGLMLNKRRITSAGTISFQLQASGIESTDDASVAYKTGEAT